MRIWLNTQKCVHVLNEQYTNERNFFYFVIKKYIIIMNVASVKLLFSLQSLVAQSISKTKNSEKLKRKKKKKKK